MTKHTRDRFRKFFQRRMQSLFLANQNGVIAKDGDLEGSSVDESQIDLKDMINVPKFFEIERLTIVNCENIQTIKEHVNLFDDDKVKFFTVQLNGDSELIGQNDIQDLFDQCPGQSIVILLKSKTDRKLRIVWKSRDIQHFLSFKHYSETFTEGDEKLYNFAASFISECLSNGHVGISKEASTNPELRDIELQQLSNPYGLQLIHLASANGNAEVVKKLLSLGCKTESAVKRINAQTCAWTHKRFNVLLVFAQENLPYPRDIEASKCSDEFKKFYKTTEELHRAIKSGDNDKVAMILDSDQYKLKYYLNLANESAPRIAIEEFQFEIYENLIVHNVCLSPQEVRDNIFEDLDYTYARIIREIHTKNSKEMPDNYINILMVNTYSAHTTTDVEANLSLIKEVYKALSKNDFCDAMLRVVAASRKIEFYYDFKSDTVSTFDPTATSNTEGIFYLKGQIYIGAKLLLSELTRNQAMAVIAHEICHCSMNLVYGNNAKPYYENDKESMRIFEEINVKCEEKSQEEPIVKLNYECYPKELQDAELIVRVPHMEILHQNNPEKLKENNENFGDLFNYAREKVMPQMIESIPKIKEREKLELEKQSERISKLKRKFYIVIALAVLVMFGLAGLFFYIFYKPTYNFDTLSPEEVVKVKDGLINFKGFEVRLKDLLVDNSTAYRNLTSEHIYQIFSRKPLDLSDSHFAYLDTMIFLSIGNLTADLKTKLLNSTFNFQGNLLRYENLNETYPGILYSLTSDEIKEILDGNILSIGNLTKVVDTEKRDRSLSKRYDSLDIVSFYKNLGLGPPYKSLNEEVVIWYYINSQAIDKSLTPSDLAVKFENSFVKFRSRETLSDTLNVTLRKRFSVLSTDALYDRSIVISELSVLTKKQLPWRWVSNVFLRDFLKLFKSRRRHLNDIPDVLERALDLKSKSQLEMEMFRESFKSNRVILLWNGIYKISPEFIQFIIKIMKYIYDNTQNVQFLSSRIECVSQLEEAFGFSPYELFPLPNHEGDEEFLEKYFGSTNASFNPSMTNLDQKEAQKLKSGKLYDVYKMFTSKRVEKWENDRNISVAEDVTKIFQKYALLTATDPILMTKNLDIFRSEIPENLTLSDLSEMGILYIHNETEFEFEHETFSDFFAAEYFLDNFYNPKNDSQIDDNILSAFEGILFSPGVFDFMTTDSSSRSANLNPKIIDLLKENGKDLFLRQLSSKFFTFDFLFKFFSKEDKKMLNELIKLDDDETLYTASFNYRYRPDLLDQKRLLKLGQTYLTADELEKFVMGRDQKGKILFGMAWYRTVMKIEKFHQNYSLGGNLGNLFNFYEDLKGNLTEGEGTELLKSLMGNPVLFYKVNNFENKFYEKLWDEAELTLDDDDKKKVLVNALSANENFDSLMNVKHYLTVCDFLFNITKGLMTSSEIFDMFRDYKILHRAAFHADIFDKFWQFFVKHTDKSQQKEILLREDSIDKIIILNSNWTFSTTPFNIFHLSLFNPLKFGSFSIIRNIYEKYFNKAEIREMILKSNEFMIHTIRLADKQTCEALNQFLEKNFDQNERILHEFLNSKVGTTNLTIFDYFVNSNYQVGVFRDFDDFIIKWNNVKNAIGEKIHEVIENAWKLSNIKKENSTKEIIFKRVEVPGTNLDKKNITNERITISDTVSEVLETRLMILSDEISSKKINVFKSLAVRIRENFPSRWVFYVTLKEYSQFYNGSGTLDDLPGLFENILDLKSESQLEREVFRECFKIDRVIFFWDGFDEISPTFSKFVENLLSNILNSSRNIQFVFTSPTYANQLQYTFNTTIYEVIKPIN